MTETTAAVAAKGGKGVTAGIIIAAIVAAIGIALWVVQMSGGMIQTAMRNLDSWGLYITMFMFFVGLSAGGLIISSVPKAFGIKGFGGISKVAVMTSIAATVGAIGFVVVDMGQPLRVWELFVYSNLGSPLMWDIIVLMVYLILSCVYLWAQIAAEKGKVSHAALRVISVVALVCAVMVHSVTAWIFGLQQSHEMWHTALLAPWFVSSALVCGTGLVICAAVALRAAGYLTWEQANLVKLAKLLAVFLLVDLYFFGCDLLTEGFPAASGAEIVSMLVSGPLAPFFWGEIVLSVLAVIICVVPQLRTSPLLAAAGIAAILAIFCKRVQLLVGGFQVANIDWPAVLTPYTVTDWEGNMAQAYQGLVYWPTPIEFGIALGVVGLSFLVFFLGLKLLPLKPADE
ncbi:NrfD/PsrC family molybdoenzyme membrane anchor subunit [Parvibacter caecicola]|uniref:Molybdopterin-containing oxidoreductase family membrane subunit n=2 Tax=Parvibacter caecicola TaxID=747645 RepID=A0A7W5D315_9ACTN|nr:NrfD/PsrC family molybdoenzyme membrane anchor subunit [Parvibacter caecicola]MBB3171732.1 molybdopterin-containing oxidoreductase family membrane subunit [Parvibacter caecicola]MCR2040703.1 polysulfide reductase NrfD [Parvibacter caecicola]RNL09414.1 polysulfide reductase [Parvibacter caecicola]